MAILRLVLPVFILLLSISTWGKPVVMYKDIDASRYPLEADTQVDPNSDANSGISQGQQSIIIADKMLPVSNDLMILNSGSVALQKRVDMIRAAKKTLELETYIFQDDMAGKIVMTELIDAAKRGVNVRLLIDVTDTGRAYFKMNEYFVKAAEQVVGGDLKNNNFEIRYYNDTHRLFRISSSYFRNHRKLFVKDGLSTETNEDGSFVGMEAIVGGRNIGDDYFDLSHHFNFNDREVWVKGTIVPQMLATFDMFWKIATMRPLPSRPTKPKGTMAYGKSGKELNRTLSQRQKNYDQKMRTIRSFFVDNNESLEVKQKIEDITRETLNNLEDREIYACPRVTFVSDKPGANFWQSHVKGWFLHKMTNFLSGTSKYMDDFRKVTDAVAYRIKSVDHMAIISSPYFMKSGWAEDLFSDLIKSGKTKSANIMIASNSLSSVDFPLVTVHFKGRIDNFLKAGIKVNAHNGKWIGEDGVIAIDNGVRNARWGSHAKTQIYDDDGFTIGTFNFDRRSAYYNTELMLFCDGSPELTSIVKKSIYYRMTPGPDGDPESGDLGRGLDILEADDIDSEASFTDRIKNTILYYVSGWAEWLF